MAATYFCIFLLLCFLNYVFNCSVHANETDYDVRTHFKYKIVLKACNNRDEACSSNNSHVCATRILKNNTLYKDFKNICYLFMSNMCDYPGKEFYVIQSGTCEDYLISRRNQDNVQDEEKSVEIMENDNSSEMVPDSTPVVLRAKSTKAPTTLYSIDTAFDSHLCPHSCPNIYAPVCLHANKGFGKYFKIMNFVNHCQADVYYCKHYQEFAPPPDEPEENVGISELSWSYCGKYRYMQFAQISEAASSLNHYGWLAGNYRYSHIMEPHERLTGYG